MLVINDDGIADLVPQQLILLVPDQLEEKQAECRTDHECAHRLRDDLSGLPRVQLTRLSIDYAAC